MQTNGHATTSKMPMHRARVRPNSTKTALTWPFDLICDASQSIPRNGALCRRRPATQALGRQQASRPQVPPWGSDGASGGDQGRFDLLGESQNIKPELLPALPRPHNQRAHEPTVIGSSPTAVVRGCG